MHKHYGSSKIFELQTKLILKKQTIGLKNQQKNAQKAKLRELNQKLAEEFKPKIDKLTFDEGYDAQPIPTGAILDIDLYRIHNQDYSLTKEQIDEETEQTKIEEIFAKEAILVRRGILNPAERTIKTHYKPQKIDEGIEVLTEEDEKIFEAESKFLEKLDKANADARTEHLYYQAAEKNHREQLTNSKTYFEIIKTQKIIDDLTTEMKQLNFEMTEIKQLLNEYFLKEKTQYLAQQKVCEIKPSVKVKRVYQDPMNEYYEQSKIFPLNKNQAKACVTSLSQAEKQNDDINFFHNAPKSSNQLIQKPLKNEDIAVLDRQLAEIRLQKQKIDDELKKLEMAEQKRKAERAQKYRAVQKAKLQAEAAEQKRKAETTERRKSKLQSCWQTASQYATW